MAERRKNGVYRANFSYLDPTTGTRTRCRRSLGTKDRREAQRREARLRIELETPPKEESTPNKRAAFSGFARHHLDQHVKVNCKHSTFRSTEQAYRVHLVPFFEDCDLRSIDVEDVERFKASKIDSHAPKTINNMLGYLSKLFNDAVTWGYADSNPVSRVRPLRLPPQEMDFWESDQSEAFLAKVQELRPQWYTFFLCALRTGLRIGELYALRWRDVDFVQRKLRVVWNWTHGKLDAPKGNRSRVVPMSPEVFTALKAHRPLRGKLVFCMEDGGYLDRNKTKHPFWTCIRAAGIPKIRLHDMRHTFASQLAMRGVPIRGIQELLGHTDIRQTMRYAHLGPSVTASYVAVLDAGACPISAPMGQIGGGNRGKPE